MKPVSYTHLDVYKRQQYGFLVDLTKCVNCELCVEACRRENHLSDDTPDRRRISLYVNAKGENVTLSTSCMHCAEPSCLQVCPAGAITKGEAGIVAVDQERCCLLYTSRCV